MIGAVLFFAGIEYTCTPDTTIRGVADVKLSNGKTDDTGYSKNECEQECAANAGCKSFVYKESTTYCEMWSKTTGTSKTGSQHCVKKTGEHFSAHMIARTLQCSSALRNASMPALQAPVMPVSHTPAARSRVPLKRNRPLKG